MTMVMSNQEENLSLREKKKIETKNKIFVVSARLFKKKGFDNITVDEITKEAGIAKGTFFNYFPTKTALLRYYGELKVEQIHDIYKNETMRNIPTREKIKNIMNITAKSYEKDKELTKLFFFEHIKYSGSRTLEEGSSQRSSKYLLYLLNEGVRKGEIRSDIDLNKTAEILSAVYIMSMVDWLRSEKDFHFSENISDKVDIIFDGIGSSRYEHE